MDYCGSYFVLIVAWHPLVTIHFGWQQHAMNNILQNMCSKKESKSYRKCERKWMMTKYILGELSLENKLQKKMGEN